MWDKIEGSESLAASYVEGGSVKYGALLGSLLGAAWLVIVGGFIRIQNAIVTVHVRLLEVLQAQLVAVIYEALLGGAGVMRTSWATAYRSAVDTAPLLAPALLALEIGLAWLILSEVWGRQELIG